LYTSLDIDPLLEHLVAVDVDKQLRDGGSESGRHAGQFGTLSGRFDELGGVLGEEGNVLAGAVFEDESRAARGADTGNRRWRKRKADGPRNAAQFFGQLRP
jgi:hypothetical protein